jgi:chromosome segregation ATPase
MTPQETAYLQRLEQKIAGLADENAQLKGDVETLNNSARQLCEQRNCLLAERDKLIADNDLLTAARNVARHERDNLQGELDRLAEAHKATQRDLVDARAELKAASAGRRVALDTLARLQRERRGTRKPDIGDVAVQLARYEAAMQDALLKTVDPATHVLVQQMDWVSGEHRTWLEPKK